MTENRLLQRVLVSVFTVAVLTVLVGCQGLVNGPTGSTPTPPTGDSLKTSVNHIVVLVQENRSFDHYFGAMRQYWLDYGYSDQALAGLPQFPTSAPSGPAPTNPGCDPASPFPASDCMVNAQSPSMESYHLITQCVENPSPSWNESHVDLNLFAPATDSSSDPTSFLKGFVYTAAHDARTIIPPYHDVIGKRAMGYYDGNDLNYYYFMASNFATSDSWFSPVMSRTPPNRMYLLAGTSQGHAYPLTSTSTLLTAPIIFQRLQEAGVSWKIYVRPGANGCTTATCLYQLSYIQNFTYGQTILNQFPQNIQPDSQFVTDAENGTLPQVAFIEPPSEVGLDEHPSDFDSGTPCCSVQAGAKYASSLVAAVMKGSWKDTIFILTFDEFGGFYDHVPPMKTVSPDGIPPSDLLTDDVCTVETGPTCDFVYTGYRVPLIVISPFTRKHFVSHTPADYTAILKLIETRFGLSALTNRDAAQMTMEEFFDFKNPSWVTPPSPPAQNMGGPCYLDRLP